ncbi:MAG: ATP-binding protein [Verrucomicrobiota bacterium]
MSWTLLLTAIAVAASFLVSAHSLKKSFTDEIDERLHRESKPVLAELKSLQQGGVQPKRGIELETRPTGLQILRVQQNGKAHRVQYALDDMLSEKQRAASVGSEFTIRGKNEKWRVAVISDGDQTGWFARSLSETDEEIAKMTKRYLRTMPLVVVFLLGSIWWVSGRMSRPVRELAKTMESFDGMNLSIRAQDDGVADELGRVTRSWNRLMDQLEGSFRQARRFSADASHELKTPLAALQGRLETALRKSEADNEVRVELAGALERVAEIRSTLDGLLLLSRADAGKLSLQTSPLDFSALVAECLEDTSAEFEAEDGKVSANVTPNIFISADRRLLLTAITNLLSNAQKYNLPEGGTISCSLEPVENSAVLSVTNTGLPIPEQDRERIFERFYRTKSSREQGADGQGLGLSLTAAIATAHDGMVWLEKSDESGTEFRFSLPLAEK